ncbi:Mup1p [Sugiyamaella lignohabitans]|uniref:Mup1p n=1 Tax=Sugiyamaella lignohabitans TaxID=796027 RepID=A0A161HL29_9ASCO|nr:Mup1p [Sugiyamaella lignohabitans]ANB13907.1 Mup1p [Sugiyamaella lignohabitans]
MASETSSLLSRQTGSQQHLEVGAVSNHANINRGNNSNASGNSSDSGKGNGNSNGKLYREDHMEEEFDTQTIASYDSVYNSDIDNGVPFDPEHGHAHRKTLGIPTATFLMLNKMIGTGIFSIPSSVYELTGSVGWSLVLWIFGGLIAYSGLNVYLEFGVEIPKSGSEKNYLERVFRRPKHLALVTFAVSYLCLSHSTSNSYAFGLYIQLAAGVKETSESYTRVIAVITVLSCILLHGIFPRAGRYLFNALGFFKVVVLGIITMSGFLVLIGAIKLDNPPDNFTNMFQNDGMGGDVYSISIALLRVFFSYRGWDNCNTVMGEIRNPAHTMGIAGPLAIGMVMFFYCFCNIAYFAVVSKQEIADSGVIVAGKFCQIIFGDSVAARVLPFFIALSNLGNILVVSYAASRVTAELGKHYLIPFSPIISSYKPFNTPFVGLLMHASLTVILLVVPPPGRVYEFVVDLSTYPITFISFSVTAGLIYLQFNRVKENWGNKPGSYHAPLYHSVAYLLTNLFLIIVPWIPPPYELKPGSFPYYAVPLGGIIIMTAGPLYWLHWRNSENAARLDAEIEKGLYLQTS